MVLTGVISEPGFKRNKANTKDVYSFKFLKDGTDKPMVIYLKTDETELQAIAVRLKNLHVTIDGQESQSGDKTYFNPIAIKESEAPKSVQSNTEMVSRVIPFNDSRQDSIEQQVAVKAIMDAFAQGQLERGEPVVQDSIQWCRVRIPHNASEIVKKAPIQAPEGMFAKGDTTPTEKDTTAKEDFVEACTKAGYNPQTKQGQSAIKAWMLKAGKTNLPFDDLAEEKQAQLIHMMKCEELEA